MNDTISAARERVQLQRPVRNADDMGGAALSWTDEGEAWAAIGARGAGAASSLDTIAATGSYLLTLRRRDDVRHGWRVMWGARVLRIVGVRDEGGPRIGLICEEELL